MTGIAEGVRCALPRHAVVDAWAEAEAAERRALLYESLWSGTVSAQELMRTLGERARVPARRELRRILEHAILGRTSPTELLAHREVFRGARWRSFEWQAELVVAGRRRRADMLHRAAKVVVELDGAAFHENALAVRRDRERDAELAAAGFITVRFSYADLRDRPQWCRECLSAAVRARMA